MESLELSMFNFWKNKKVFITGHTGFKGSWLALWLQRMGAEVYGYSLKPQTKQNLFTLARIDSLLHSDFGDIRDFENFHNAVSSFSPEIIFHLAAQPLVRPSYSDPLLTYSTNVLGTVNLLEIVRQSDSVRAVVNVTTDKCYENKDSLWGYRECDPLGGHDPYSASKGCAELITMSYNRSFFEYAHVGLASARAGNVIGGGDWSPERLVPDILRHLTDRKLAKIRNPLAVRPWQHVLEPLSGYMQLAMRLYQTPQKYCGGWNFGPVDHHYRNAGWVADAVCAQWGGGASWIAENSFGPHEAKCLKLDISKASTLLKWLPKWGVETAIAKTVDWHKLYLAGEDPNSVMHSQIDEYSLHLSE
jgi:CDP-glucose 4,6-dehydratase